MSKPQIAYSKIIFMALTFNGHSKELNYQSKRYDFALLYIKSPPYKFSLREILQDTSKYT